MGGGDSSTIHQSQKGTKPRVNATSTIGIDVQDKRKRTHRESIARYFAVGDNTGRYMERKQRMSDTPRDVAREIGVKRKATHGDDDWLDVSNEGIRPRLGRSKQAEVVDRVEGKESGERGLVDGGASLGEEGSLARINREDRREQVMMAGEQESRLNGGGSFSKKSRLLAAMWQTKGPTGGFVSPLGKLAVTWA